MQPTLIHGDVETIDLTELARFMLCSAVSILCRTREPYTVAGRLPERPGAEQGPPAPPAIQPHMGESSHVGGSGPGIGMASLPGSEGGLPDLDRGTLLPESLTASRADKEP